MIKVLLLHMELSMMMMTCDYAPQVTSNTHSAKFYAYEFQNKDDARKAYADAIDALLAVGQGFKPHKETKCRFVRNGLGTFRQLPQSMFWRIIGMDLADAHRAQSCSQITTQKFSAVNTHPSEGPLTCAGSSLNFLCPSGLKCQVGVDQ